MNQHLSQFKDSVKLSISGFLIIALFFTLTIPTISFWPDDQDGVNFLMGIDHYSLQFHQPHFPGYPLYIAVCKALKVVTGISSEKSAVAISILSGVGVLGLIFLMIEKRYTLTTAFASVFILALNPVFFEFSHKIFSEMPALFILLCGVYALGKPDSAPFMRWFISIFLLGVMLGIRLSWWPFSLFYLIAAARNRHGFTALFAFTFGIFFWLIPLIWIVGFWDFYNEGVSFVHGHFYQWGGAVSSSNSTQPRALSTFLRISEILGRNSGGWELFFLPVSLFQVLSLFYFMYIKEKSDETIHYFLAATLYMVWVILGQNLEKVRHFIPLLPLLIMLAASLINKWPKVIFMILMLSLSGRVSEYSGREFQTPPAVRFSQWLNKTRGATRNFYCGSSERFFDRYPASHDNILSVKGFEELDFKIKSSLEENSDYFICDDIPGFAPLKGARLVVTFPARAGDLVDKPLRVYKFSDNFLKDRF